VARSQHNLQISHKPTIRRRRFGGGLQRVSIGGPLVRNPAVYLYGEPSVRLMRNCAAPAVELKEYFSKLAFATFPISPTIRIEAMTMPLMSAFSTNGPPCTIWHPTGGFTRILSIYAATVWASRASMSCLLMSSAVAPTSATFIGLTSETDCAGPKGEDRFR